MLNARAKLQSLRPLIGACVYDVKLSRYVCVLNHANNYQLLSEVGQNIVICYRRADQLFAEAEG